ncbi:MAG: nucleotidyltransferase domain-containing protein [Candidatus Methanoperedens sp.]|nr:nucleotidyltransferase domain-containing protein [Candidatus Methanoperedens sp.]MCZ7405893.1 nucleotidyltransferase domain-containing protein [Candidatus Methanoperedens sp.]
MFELMNILSKPALQILQHLGRRYREGYYVRELSRNLSIGLGTASQSLRALENAGLIVKEKKGRLVIYRANMENSLLREFKVLLTMMEVNTLIQRLEDTSSRIILFGSCATGEDTIDSDIDIFIVTQDKNRIFELIDDYQKKIERKLSPIVMSPFEFEQLKTKDKPLYERINMGKIIIEAHEISI